MGAYLDALENWNVTPYNVSFNLKNDTITEAFTVAKEKTNDSLGSGLLMFIFFVIYIHISKRENQFELSQVQAFISTNTIVLCFALMFIYLGIMNSIQVFVWCVLLFFIGQVWGIMRTTN